MKGGLFPLIVNYQDCSKNPDITIPDHGWKFWVPLFGTENDFNMWTSQCDRFAAFNEASDWVLAYIRERNPYPHQDEPRLVWVPKGRTIRWVTPDHLAVEE